MGGISCPPCIANGGEINYSISLKSVFCKPNKVKPVRLLTKANHFFITRAYVALKHDRKHNEKHDLLAKLKRIGFGNSSAVGILIRKASMTVFNVNAQS